MHCGNNAISTAPKVLCGDSQFRRILCYKVGMSEVLLKWREPKLWQEPETLVWRILHRWPAVVVALIVFSLYCGEYHVHGLVAGLVIGLSSRRPITNLMTSKGIQIGESFHTRGQFFHWDEIEWYEIEPMLNQPDWLQIMLKVRRRKKTRIVTFRFLRYPEDESTLLRIFGDYLVDKDAQQLPRPERYQELAQ
jgi:hypothetical protein